MRTVFDEKLAELHRDLLELGVLVNRAIFRSVQGFIEHDVAIAKEVINGDARVNDKEHEIDRKCQEIIAMQQPNTTDLRRIIAVLRVSSNLERMGDHAVSISKSTINLKGNKRNLDLENLINEMATIVIEMSHDIIDAFVDFDVDKAYSIAKIDAKVDALYNDVRMTAVEAMQNDPNTVIAVSDYAFVGMHIERIGDYVTNISEGIIYLDSGKVVDLKHH